MKNSRQFIQETLLRGVFFLVPLAVTLFLLGKVLDVTSKLIAPITRQLPDSHLAWIPTLRLVAILALLLACFLAGLLARAAFAQGVVGWLERTLLDHIPGYSYMKTMGATLVGAEGGREYKAVIARIEDSWQMGFLVEYVPGGHSAVFVPGTPSPWSGSVYFMTEDRFRVLDVPLAAAMGCVKHFGSGAEPILRGKADWKD